MPPKDLRDLRRMMRYRNMIVRESVRMKNKISGFLMETGAEYDGAKLHGKKYFAQLLETIEHVPPSVIEMLGLTRGVLDFLNSIHKSVRKRLLNDPRLRERVDLLKTIDGVGDITALTWAVEICDPHRFPGVREAVSYCGLCSAQKSSAGVDRRGPISKSRNKHIQAALVEAAKIAPIHNEYLRVVYMREKEKGNRNRATLAVARKLVAFLMHVDKNKVAFENKNAVAV
jgi:transposase